MHQHFHTMINCWKYCGDNMPFGPKVETISPKEAKENLSSCHFFCPRAWLCIQIITVSWCGCRSERFCLHGALFNQIVKHSTCSMSTHIHRLHVLSLLYIANTPVFTFAPRWQWSLWVTLTHNIGIQSDLREGAVPWEKKKKKRTRGSREQVTRTESEHTQKKKKIKVWGEVCEKSR